MMTQGTACYHSLYHTYTSQATYDFMLKPDSHVKMGETMYALERLE